MSDRRSSVSKGIAAAIALLLFAAGCGGGDAGTSSDEEAGDPVRGGSVAYGLEAETTGGWCLPEAQLAISGILVARTVYDTLTAPNGDGEYVPYLAKSVEGNEDSTEWTITLREGVKFHDGTPLDAEVVKNNLDAYRGKYEGRAPLLFLFVFQNLTDVAVVDDMTVKVTTEKPWVAFPAYLFASGRLGIMAQSQLDDQESCDRKLVGTGPFKQKSWRVNQEFVAEKNPDYWQEAPDGKPYPYLDEIRFQPTPEPAQRINGLQAGQLQMMHASGADEFVDLRALEEAGTVELYESEKFAEVSYVMINASVPPTDDVRVRRALAMAIDRQEYKEIINQGLFTMASGPYAPGSIGYLEDSGYPTYNPERAKELVEEYEDEKGPLKITFKGTPSPAIQRVAQFLQERLKEVGIEFTLQTVEQSELINTAISGDFQLIGWRNHPGGDPDEQYVWWYKGSPANFGRFQDDVMQGLLDEGRSEADPAKRKEIYEDVNRRFADQVWNLWANWTRWVVAYVDGVHGVNLETAPKLPDGSDPFPGLATGHPVHGIWIEE